MNILSVKQYSMKHIMWNQWWKYTAFTTLHLLVYYTVFSLAGMYKTAEKSDLKKSLESHVKIQSGDCQLVSNTALTLNAYLIWINRKNEKKVQCFLASTILDVSHAPALPDRSTFRLFCFLLSPQKNKIRIKDSSMSNLHHIQFLIKSFSNPKHKRDNTTYKEKMRDKIY